MYARSLSLLCFPTHPSHNQPGLDFTLSLGELADAHQDYRRAMAHWKANLPPGRIYTLQYEDLVSDFEGTLRSLLGHLELVRTGGWKEWWMRRWKGRWKERPKEW